MRLCGGAPLSQQTFADAQAMLKLIISEHWLEARGVVGFYPANSVVKLARLTSSCISSSEGRCW